jgi:[protein-PII] uridylyltransferase
MAEAIAPRSVPGLDPFVLELREFHKKGIERIREKHRAGGGGLQIVEETTGLMDQVVQRAWTHALKEASKTTGLDFSRTPPRVALIPIGGYGRAQLHPRSDVDILFLHKSNLNRSETEIIKFTLHTLYDTGLEIGHAARTIGDCLRIAAADLDTRTALMENRFLAGNRDLFERFHHRYHSYIQRSGIQAFIRQKEVERQLRYRKYGDTVSLQEPHLKESAGGLRDLHHGIWLGIAVYDISALPGMRRQGLVREPFYGQLLEAVDFLFRIRNELHLNLKTSNNKLTFEVQEKVAKALHYADEGVNLAEESLMRDYYSHAYSIQQFADLMSNRCLQSNPVKRLVARFRKKHLGEGFYLKGGQLTVDNPETIFLNHPERIVQLFGIFQRVACSLHPELRSELTQTLSATMTEDIATSKECSEMLVQLLSKPGRVGPLFRILYETGFLDVWIPEFKVIRNLPRRDLYHKYTVDEHSLITVEILDALAKEHAPEDAALSLEELTGRFPAARRKWRWWGVEPMRKQFDSPESEIAANNALDDVMTLPIPSKTAERILREIRDVFGSIQKPHVLYLATFLHDIGKGRGGEHHIKGAAIACEVCRRLNLPDSDTDLVIFLVEKHLELAKIAFRFDTSDFGTVQQFASWCDSAEKLDYLYLLTLADIWAVSTELLTEWKLSMLHQFYTQVRLMLKDRRKAEQAREEKQRHAYQQIMSELPRDISETEAERHFGKMPAKYVPQHSPDQLYSHLRLLRKYTGERPVVGCRQTMTSAIEVVTLQPSRIGNFMRVARSMASLGLSIMEARIFIRDDGLAINTLTVMHHEGSSFREETRDRVVERTVLSLEDKWDDAWNPKSIHKLGLGRFRFEPHIEIYNRVSPQFTVVEVRCADVIGVLVTITSVLAKYGLDIRVARIHTEEQRVFDTFYVLDQARQKFEDPQKINWLKASLVKELKKHEADSP